MAAECWVVYHLVPTSNHNPPARQHRSHWLFIILFLHQTTTRSLFSKVVHRCLSSCSYIKPQPVVEVVPIHDCCLSSCSYIKPQPYGIFKCSHICCLSSCSYIKPQRLSSTKKCRLSCLSSCSYIKPQLIVFISSILLVVYHLVPTSNHNGAGHCLLGLVVVYHLVPTSNHNKHTFPRKYGTLFIILFLHQTTTERAIACSALSVVYHLVPTSNHNTGYICCTRETLFIILFLHQTTTCPSTQSIALRLFIILFLHQTTTIKQYVHFFFGCLSSCSYIKPQPIATNLLVISKILRFELIRNGRAGRFLLQIY